MTTDAFKEYVKTCRALDTEEIHRFMDDMSNEARRITFRLNTAYHTQDEVRGLLSELFGYEVPESLRVFPPFYADFGKNITVGEGPCLPLALKINWISLTEYQRLRS